ncbi:hypothetical protein C8Q77DRAFT_1148027 [Trametes polyzona]|nr:hypothetical protein C8Q77DRAFT_1148027 [Trametes polyzona]
MSTTVLSCSHAARRAVFARHLSRTLATETLESSTKADSTPPVPKRRPTQRENTGGLRNSPQDTYSIYVRAWDEIDSMPSFFAMLRGVEKRFGRAREFRIQRDYDVETTYTNYFIVDLESEEAYKRVPEAGTSIKVEVPVVNKNRPGGIGLEELQDLLHARDWDPETSGDGIYSEPVQPLPAGEQKTRTVELIVKRSETQQRESRVRRRQQEDEAFGIAFARWRGFYKPTDENGPLQQPAMRQALAKWERTLSQWQARQTRRGRAPTDQAAEDAEADAAIADIEAAVQKDAAEAEAASSEDGSTVEGQHSSGKVTSSEAHSTTAVLESGDAASPPASASSDQQQEAQEKKPARLSQREKILIRARQHAKTPLPEPQSKEEVEQRKAAEKEAVQEEQKKVNTLRDRLAQLIGNGW